MVHHQGIEQVAFVAGCDKERHEEACPHGPQHRGHMEPHEQLGVVLPLQVTACP